MSKIPLSFYQREDVVIIARELLGKVLITNINGERTEGIITETEAYAGITDRASHAYGDRRTQRTEVMYAAGGVAYVYLCYGMHALFNIVTYKKEVPHAILIRAIEPLKGIDIMLQRSGKEKADKNFCIGPGKVTKALGIHCKHTGISLTGKDIWLEERGITVKKIQAGPRIGVDYAKEDALLPYRFWTSI
jgi:DNA-3-methyladenine glycosylase